MALATSGLHHLALRVTDLERARQFYVDTLGFQPVMEFPGVILINANSTLIGLRGADTPTTRADRFDPHRVGLDHLALGVASVDALAEMKQALDSAGVRNNGIEDDPALGAKYISFYDPDGIAWELYAMPTPK